MEAGSREETVRQVRLGRTGLNVSRLGFGGIPIQRLGEAEAVDVVRGCLDLGVTFVDTANGYTTSEERIGKAIAGRREGLVIATKTHAQDRAGARANLELSLRRLGVERIDVYQLHGVSSAERLAQVTGPGGAYEELLEARAQGLIGHIGVSSHSLETAKSLVASDLFETIQFPFNFIADEPERDLLPLVREKGMGFIAMKPMGGGLIPNARLAIRYLAQFEGVVADPGIQAVSEMAELIDALPVGAGHLDDADRLEIQAVRAELGTRFCHRCDYCQPCSEEIAISTVLSIGSNMRRFPLDRVFGEQMTATVRKALDCEDCGLCEQRCPYNLSIRDMLAERAEFYFREKERYEASLAR
jgi:predicted aldo/keto reductase-like oxidoreductase